MPPREGQPNKPTVPKLTLEPMTAERFVNNTGVIGGRVGYDNVRRERGEVTTDPVIGEDGKVIASEADREKITRKKAA